MNGCPDRNRLRIAMVIDAYDDSINGAVISTKRFVELLQREHDVTIITTGDPAPGKVLLPKFYAPLFIHIMKRMHVPLGIPVNRILKNTIREMDIIHIQFPFYLSVRAITIAKKYHVPVVATFHIQAEHLAMNAGIKSKKFIRNCYRFWMKNIYNPSDLVICPSKFAEDELRHFGLKTSSVIISNGILPIFRPIDVSRDGSLKDKFVILSVGRFAPEKRQNMIIEAIRDSKHRNKIQLMLIGEGPMKEKLQEEGKFLPNPPIFMTLSPEELPYYYNTADLYVHAAQVEVECMTVLEAIGCGLPTLIANCPKSATRQFALDDRYLFESENPSGLMNKIDYWIEHPDELKEAKVMVHEESHKYRIENSYEKLISQYMKLVKETTMASSIR